MIVTVQQIEEQFEWEHIRHGNKGYPRDDKGDVIMRGPDLTEEPYHLGYTWTFRAIGCPRLTFSDHIMHPDKPDWRVWHVDGDDVPDLEAACCALLRPPLLTLLEYLVLERIGEFPCDHFAAIDRAAGAVNPTPNFIEGRWSRVSQCIDSLRAKGILCYRDGNLEIAT